MLRPRTSSWFTFLTLLLSFRWRVKSSLSTSLKNLSLQQIHASQNLGQTMQYHCFFSFTWVTYIMRVLLWAVVQSTRPCMSKLKNLAVGFLHDNFPGRKTFSCPHFFQTKVILLTLFCWSSCVHVFTVNGLSSSFVYSGVQLLTSGETC